MIYETIIFHCKNILFVVKLQNIKSRNVEEGKRRKAKISKMLNIDETTRNFPILYFLSV